MEGQPAVEVENVADQYDAVLQAVEEGLILTVNHNQTGMVSSEELTVMQSSDDETNVLLNGYGESQYRICRDGDDELVYGEVTENGFAVEDSVITLEILGVKK